MSRKDKSVNGAGEQFMRLDDFPEYVEAKNLLDDLDKQKKEIKADLAARSKTEMGKDAVRDAVQSVRKGARAIDAVNAVEGPPVDPEDARLWKALDIVQQVANETAQRVQMEKVKASRVAKEAVLPRFEAAHVKLEELLNGIHGTLLEIEGCHRTLADNGFLDALPCVAFGDLVLGGWGSRMQMFLDRAHQAGVDLPGWKSPEPPRKVEAVKLSPLEEKALRERYRETILVSDMT